MEEETSHGSADDRVQSLLERGESRRRFLKQAAVASTALAAAHLIHGEPPLASAENVEGLMTQATSATATSPISVKLKVNGAERALNIEPRVTLLDALRENLGLTGTKKGCDHGQCGACTVLVEGRRINSCLTLAVMQVGHEITTIEGLARGEELHPLQAAFIKHDGFQCGYCTPGQICSAVGMLKEAEAHTSSHVTPNVAEPPRLANLSNEEIRERMSGNICRCGAYPNIVAAIREARDARGKQG